MKIAVASDHRGFEVKDRIVSFLSELQHECHDFGTSSAEVCDYPDYAAVAAQAVSEGRMDRAILICCSGIGMCIVANKFKGVRAALCHDDLAAEMSRRHNDSNVLCLSADLLSDRLASRMIELWLETPFEGGRHTRRIDKIAGYEAKQ
jgi:ribose 5-phosphate isomerase B